MRQAAHKELKDTQVIDSDNRKSTQECNKEIKVEKSGENIDRKDSAVPMPEGTWHGREGDGTCPHRSVRKAQHLSCERERAIENEFTMKEKYGTWHEREGDGQFQSERVHRERKTWHLA
jgi:hypothetical protein